MSRKLVDLLHKERLITETQAAEANALLKAGQDPIRTFVDQKIISESKLLYFLSQRFSLPSINLAKYEIKPEVIALVNGDLARKLGAIPIQTNKGILVVAITDPTHIDSLDDIRFATKMNVEAVLITYSAYDQAMMRYYGGTSSITKAVEQFRKESNTSVEMVTDQSLSTMHEIDSGSNSADEAPVISTVNGILTESLRRGASDIHVEPYEKDFRVRMRIDGTLIDVLHIPMEMRRAVIARFKIMSRMDISESRVPQDGRIKIKVGGREVDFRVNSLPTLFGEKVVLRILSKGNLQLDLQKLGFEPKQLELFRKGVTQPSGMVLVTGPTGSGKTTTLYSALMELNQIGDNLSTVEDPVEYNLEGINQVQINKDVGLTFASALRALLRQDPDSILVGEIRDYETGEVAVQAALTGHLVLSTLHTNDTVATITRLVNMGIEPFLVTASVNSIIAQRLLRTLCKKCKIPASIPAEFAKKLAALDPNGKVFSPKGCSECANTGYKGRVAVYEVLDFSQNLKEMVLANRTAIEIKRAAIEEGLQTLRTSALKKALEGRVSVEEAVSMTAED
jgi:type IV pilus assembly protein PilB